jgi:transcriptional regulator with XRE-family HTH domain
MDKNYAKAFRVIRAAFGLKQAELAERMPISASQLSLIEAGKRQPSLKVLDSFARAVGVPSALLSLLASTPNDVNSAGDETVSDLAKSLLRLLIAAEGDQQRSLDLSGSDR